MSWACFNCATTCSRYISTENEEQECCPGEEFLIHGYSLSVAEGSGPLHRMTSMIMQPPLSLLTRVYQRFAQYTRLPFLVGARHLFAQRGQARRRRVGAA